MTRLAYVASTVPSRIDCVSAPVDAETLVALSSTHDVVALVDQDDVGVDLLREAGVPVHISPARNLQLPDGRWVTADGAQARLVAGLHETHPLDAIVYGPGAYTDYAWFEPTLRTVARVACLGGHLLRDLRLILDDPALCRTRGRMAAAAATFVASADSLVGEGAPEDYGLLANDLPPRFTLREAPVRLVERTDEVPRLVALVAGTEDRVGLATLVPRLLDRVPIGPHTLVAAIVPSLALTVDRTEDLVLAGCPSHVEGQVIVVPPTEDGAASNMVRSADLLVAARCADLATLAVRVAAETTPLCLLDSTPFPVLPLLDARTPVVDTSGERVIFSADCTLTEATALLDLFDEAEFAVLHTSDGGNDAARLLRSPRLGAVDLVVLGRPDSMFGTAEVEELAPSVLAAHRSIWPPLRRRMRECGNLWELIIACVELSELDRTRVLVLPAGPATPTLRLPFAEASKLPFWVGRSPLLPRPNLVGGYLRDRPVDDDTNGVLRTWAETHRWHERLRLALPTRYGLLHRAMRGRW